MAVLQEILMQVHDGTVISRITNVESNTESEKELTAMTHEEKEQRLDEILSRLDRSETPMDQLSAEAKDSAELIMSMQARLKSTKAELKNVFLEMDRQKEQLDSAVNENHD